MADILRAYFPVRHKEMQYSPRHCGGAGDAADQSKGDAPHAELISRKLASL